MENEFVTYDIALAMKGLGFDEYCITYYGQEVEGGRLKFPPIVNPNNFNDLTLDIISAPTYQKAFRWFREEHLLVGSIGFDEDVKGKWGGSVTGHYETHGKFNLGFTGWFETYQEAQDACLRKLIEIVKEKDQIDPNAMGSYNSPQ